MEMNDDEAHFGIIDGPLRRPAPRLLGAGIIREDPNDLKMRGIDKIQCPGIGNTAAENEVELAHPTSYRLAAMR